MILGAIGAISSSIINAVPSLNVTPTSLTFGSTIVGAESNPQSFSVTGSDLSGDVTITPSDDFSIDTGNKHGAFTPIVLTPVDGVISQTIYVFFSPQTNGSKSENISASGGGASTQNVSAAGTALQPTLGVTPGSLSFSDTTVGQTSTTQTFDITGSDLTGDITVTTATGYLISTSPAGGASDPIVLTNTGTLSQTIYVSFAPSSPGSTPGTISITGGGASEQDVSVMGTGTAALTTIYSENFDAGEVGAWPIGWTVNTGSFAIDEGEGLPSCDLPLSSGYKMFYGADMSGVAEYEWTTSKPFSTVGYTGIKVSWNGRRTIGTPTLILEYSLNGIDFSNITFTDVATDDAWHALTPISLPPTTEGQATVYLKWKFLCTIEQTSTVMSFDDLLIQGVSGT